MLPGPVSIVTLKGLGAIAQQRPQYLGRILPTLLKLASVLTQPQVQISAGLGPATIPGMLSAKLLSCMLLDTYRCACRCDFVLSQVKDICFTRCMHLHTRAYRALHHPGSQPCSMMDQSEAIHCKACTAQEQLPSVHCAIYHVTTLKPQPLSIPLLVTALNVITYNLKSCVLQMQSASVAPGFAGRSLESIYSRRGEGPQGCPAVCAALPRPAGADLAPQGRSLPGSPGRW